MKRKIFNMLNDDSEVSKIMNRSSRAVCGINEREIVVRKSEVEATKRLLKKAGNFIVGTGKAGTNSIKIWFNPIGGF